MSRKQGPHSMGMRPPAIAAGHRQLDARMLLAVKEVAPA